MVDDKRKRRRVSVGFPVKVVGTDANGRHFDEMSHTVNVSSAAIKFPIKALVRLNDILTVTLPLPKDMRPVITAEPAYTTRAMVSRIEESAASAGGRTIVARFTR